MMRTIAGTGPEFESLIDEENWHSFGLPDPENLLAALKNKQSQEINGHRLTSDEHGIWITNPYGVDCGLWQAVSIEIVKSFLIDMARGKDYGFVPQ